jgi:hypothetical protein
MDTTASLLLRKQLSELNKHPVEGKKHENCVHGG